MIQVVKCEAVGKGKLSVRFDNGTDLLLYRGEARQMEIWENAFVSEEKFQILLDEIVSRRAKKRLLYLLEQRDYTERQLRDKLASSYPPECIDSAIAYVKGFHYLDDYRYACNLIRCSQAKASRSSLRLKLARRGVDRELIERALEEEYEGEETTQIEILLQKRHYDADRCDEKEFARIYRFLMRRGFKSSDILKVMQKPCGNLVS